jgi:hypothetical protein
MKSTLIQLFLFLSIAFFSSCYKSNDNVTTNGGGTEQGYFIINGDKYPINKAYYAVSEQDSSSGLLFVSPELNYNSNLEVVVGSNGNMIIFQFPDGSSILKVANYYTPTLSADMCIGYSATDNMNQTCDSGHTLDDTKAGNMKITKSGNIYTIQFDFSIENGNKVSGYFTGIPLRVL